MLCVFVQDPSTSEQLLTPLVAVMTVLADQNAPSKYMHILDVFYMMHSIKSLYSIC